jgi:hypothetical protein
MAFNLSNDVRVAFNIILGEMEGGTFDFERGCWKNPQT